MIKYEKDQFVIYDNNSKFGTLVLMKEPFDISNEKIGIQIGRTVISLSLKPNENLLNRNNSVNETNAHPNNLNKGSLKAISKANTENWEKKEKNSTKNKENIKETETVIKLEPKNNKPDEDDILDFYGKNPNMDEEMNPEENEK